MNDEMCVVEQTWFERQIGLNEHVRAMNKQQLKVLRERTSQMRATKGEKVPRSPFRDLPPCSAQVCRFFPLRWVNFFRRQGKPVESAS